MSAADNAPTVSEEDVERYLLKYNYAKALSALRAEKQGQPSATATTTTLNDFARANAPTAAIRKDDKLLLDWRTKVDSTGWVEGLRGLAEFVHSVSGLLYILYDFCRSRSQSLDLHRPELLPILLPILVHTYLDLVGNSNVDLARRVLAESVRLYPREAFAEARTGFKVNSKRRTDLCSIISPVSAAQSSSTSPMRSLATSSTSPNRS